MKLRNKKTGEINLGDLHLDDFNSLAELNAEWEDYEEPKKYWRIDCDGEIEDYEYEGTSFEKDCKEIGNYFETKEEAEKAVEKLKAWKRLKDKGFRFQFWTSSYSGDNISFFIDWINADSKKEIEEDLDLLFGGEE